MWPVGRPLIERRYIAEVVETFMAVVQKTGPGSNPCVSKSDSDHRTATTAHRTLGLPPTGTICHSNLSLSQYPLRRARQIEWSRRSVHLASARAQRFFFLRRLNIFSGDCPIFLFNISFEYFIENEPGAS